MTVSSCWWFIGKLHHLILFSYRNANTVAELTQHQYFKLASTSFNRHHIPILSVFTYKMLEKKKKVGKHNILTCLHVQKTKFYDNLDKLPLLKMKFSYTSLGFKSWFHLRHFDISENHSQLWSLVHQKWNFFKITKFLLQLSPISTASINQ